MLSSISKCTNFAKVSTRFINGHDWLSTSDDGKTLTFSAGPGKFPDPPEAVVMALGACAGETVKAIFDYKKYKYSKIDIDIDYEYNRKPQKRLDNIKITVSTDAEIEPERMQKVLETTENKGCIVAGSLKHNANIKAYYKKL